ncbi:MAG: hypothetical protein WD276_10790 [Actinomycetota bacterium]
MKLLRTVLYVNAVVTTAVGVILVLVPSFVLNTLFDLNPYPENAWVRIAGIEAVGLAMIMVLVAQSVEKLYWWAWAFLFVDVAMATLITFKVIAGLGAGAGSKLWWLLGGGATLLAAGLLVGLGKAGRETPAV